MNSWLRNDWINTNVQYNDKSFFLIVFNIHTVTIVIIIIIIIIISSSSSIIIFIIIIIIVVVIIIIVVVVAFQKIFIISSQ